VVRRVGSRRRLEFPIGTVLHETDGWISTLRVSPDGRRVAFLDHPDRGDDVAAVTVVDREGQSGVLARDAHRGIAWSPSGEEVVHLGTDNSLWATRLSGQSRLLFQTLGDASIQDVAADGRMLLTIRMMRRELVGRGPGDSVERNLSWGDWSFPSFLSSDGRTVLFDEAKIVTDGDYGLFLRSTDGSPPVRLGNGRPFALSPDGRWVLAASQGGGTVQLRLAPTGAGQARRLFSLEAVPSAAGFLPDGERLAFLASVAGEGRRLYVHDLSGGPPRAISPEGVTSSSRRLFFPDGRFALAHSPEGQLTLYPIDEGEGEPLVVLGTSPQDIPVGWHQDGRTLFVQRPTGLPAQIEEVNIETGERRLWKELTPPDPAGVSVIFPIHVSADGRAYVYSYRRVLDRLTVVDGLLETQ
jgi:Tol biopolymer transport system component